MIIADILPISIMSLLYPLEDEFCAPANATTSFAVEYGFATLQMAQISIVAYISTLFNVGVLWHHWTHPPHPKFVLRAPRKISIRLHVLSGTVEIIFWCLAWFCSSMELRETFTQIQVIASFVHCATAAYQTPIVFGTQAIMVPVYVCCIVIKVWCGADLWLNPACALKSVRLYNILSIYTWCRVLVALFVTMQMFESSVYSIAILLAGAACLPSFGPATFVLGILVVGAYCFAVNKWATPVFKAQQFSEHGRDMFDSSTFHKILAAASHCPFASVEGMGHKQRLRSLFDSLDVNKSGSLSNEELKAMATMHGAASWLDALSYHENESGVDGKELTFEDFSRVLGTRTALRSQNDELAAVMAPGASFNDQARYLFDTMRSGIEESKHGGAALEPDDHMSTHDLAYVLMQYNLPASEARHAMRKYDTSKNGKLSFAEFKAGFGPLIRFQMAELKGKVRELNKSASRIAMEQKSAKEEDKEGKDRGVLDKMEFAVDDTLDAVDRGANSLVGGVKRAVSKYVQLEDPPSA